MKKLAPEQLASQIIEFYNDYDLKVSGKINDQTAYQLIASIEQHYQTDTIRLTDGTRIWNLLRIFLYSHFQKIGEKTGKRTLNIQTMKAVFSILKESFIPLRFPQNITVCGFSSAESRKLYNDTYYDIYLDPLYDILGDALAVFEWPETTGYRRKYDKPVYSKHHVPMHIPLWSTTFWELLIHKITGRRNFSLESEDILQEIIVYISTTASVDKATLTKDIDDFITVFVSMKRFLSNILKKIKPRAVLIRCGYGRFPMALSQACRELHIPPVELQHGLITSYLPAYRRATPTSNTDCLPEYLLAQGDIYAEMVRDGNLFDKDKVLSTGYPYLQRLLHEKKEDLHPKQTYSSFPKNILFTSQWIVATEIKDFVMTIADQLEQQHLDIGILFKPHPYDKNTYTDLQKNKHIILINKYEDTFKLFSCADIHSTVYSTSGLEAMAFSIPNIFVDIYNLADSTTPYLVQSPTQFIESVTTILSLYKDIVLETKTVADLFFTPSPEEHFRKFFTDLKIL
ncbi:MAG: CDP-glycerol glycerophosphotransferase family protein [Candidatus Thermoplasmatota archaeon]|nr:CDP-glycerol glycerophosphotransferase family protein [Candidatus Thermoplasmatota archaeon]